ncbi:hypothetical protein ASF06_06415 [Agreia sp. Leaf244]|uniref:hypothetical protein n=1 Tax=Agreia sp. Leaf244 TaxID=1736305 RepID=UPI0006FBCBD4|nr:hypothetical protein [Agreia sp. Leaf244]KQO09880.1 hypothetical protein ASF06_06415 [Agreia sp. Leaf244]
MEHTSTDGRFKTAKPSVYLDQWVWIRLARANVGRPFKPSDVALLESLKTAAEAGVAFPLSATHYEETIRIADPAQRKEIARVMAPIAMGRTIRKQSDLVRHQLLTALHETIGRPTFRPAPLQMLGLGVHWSFTGIEGFMTVVDPDGRVVKSVDPNWTRQLNQYCEFALMAGPADAEIPILEKLGYVDPRYFESNVGNRLDWEESYVDQAVKIKSREELRVALFAREIMHEYGVTLQTILNEYRLSLGSIATGSKANSRAQMMSFSDRVPTMRIAVDMKRDLFRNPSRPWTWNMLRDIDALSVAVPLCDVVICDRDALHQLRRSGAPDRYGTTVTEKIEDLPDLLTDLARLSPAAEPDLSDWASIGPGDGFSIVEPEPPGRIPMGSSIQLLDRGGRPLPTPLGARRM